MRKLLKHEIKDSWLEIVILNGLTVILSVVFAISIKSGSPTFISIATISWSGVLMASSVVVLRYLLKSFHKSLFTNHGYLTLTLPISIDKILLSKIIVNFLWIIITAISFILSLIIIVYLFAGATYAGATFSSLFELIKRNPASFIKGMIMFLAVVLCMIMIWVLILVFTNTGRMKKHKFLKGLLVYLILSAIMSIIAQIVFESAQNLSANAIYTIILLIFLAFSVLSYLITRYFIINKLELE